MRGARLGRRAAATAAVSTKWRIYINCTELGFAAGNGNASIAECEMRASAGGADLCTGGTATASSTLSSNTASNAFANNGTTSVWTANSGDDEWLQYEFASPVTIEEVYIQAANNDFGSGNSPVDFEVQYDSGGGVFVTYWSALTGPFGMAEPRVFNRTDAAPTGKRWWRFYVTNLTGTAARLSCSEIEMRLTNGGADQCSGGYAFARAHLSTLVPAAAFANDGTTTFFAELSSTVPTYIGYAFPADVDIEEVTFRARGSFANNESPEDFKLQFGCGGVWTDVVSITGQSFTDGETKTYNGW